MLHGLQRFDLARSTWRISALVSRDTALVMDTDGLSLVLRTARLSVLCRGSEDGSITFSGMDWVR